MKYRYNPVRKRIWIVLFFLVIFLLCSLCTLTAKVGELERNLEENTAHSNMVLTLNTEWNGYLTETAQVPRPVTMVTAKNRTVPTYVWDGDLLVETAISFLPGVEIPVYDNKTYRGVESVYEVVTTSTEISYYVLAEDVMEKDNE